MPPTRWGTTLKLPKSQLPARANVADRNKYLLQCTTDLYSWQRKHANSSPSNSFTLHDGPPYANGSLHIGHALNKILKDITCRYKISQGRRVDYTPGWDCHGLPIELKALNKWRGDGHDMGHEILTAVGLRNIARKLAVRTVGEQKAEFQKWAVMADWDNAWTTMDKDFELRQLEVFKKLLEKGLIYQQFKPVHWSPSTQTALAESELEYRDDHASTAAYIKFPLASVPEKLMQHMQGRTDKINAVIWTTTPWTLLANKAIAVQNNITYALVDSQSQGLLLIAEQRLKEVENLIGGSGLTNIIASFQGSELVGERYHHPAFGGDASTQPIVHGDFVVANSGTGLVHMAPGHGMDDYKLCLQHGIEPYAPVDDNGCFTADALPHNPKLLEGLDVMGAGNEEVISYLKGLGALLTTHKIVHKYPYDWRSKRPVITRATQQWFADVGTIREPTLKALDSVTFIPEAGKERLISFVENRSEWCISRQRAWGVPIPALYKEGTGEALLTSASVSHVIETIKERGIEAWWTDEEYDVAWTPPSLRDGPKYYRGKDTMDVWFDSGTSWTHMGKQSNGSEFPAADIYLEGSDQHRGWFQSSILTKVAFQSATNPENPPSAPFKTLVTHGFTLDKHSKKMSKSEGNVVSPKEIMDGTLLPPLDSKYGKRSVKHGDREQKGQTKIYDGLGPDALRLWVATTDYTSDVVVSQPVLKTVNGHLNKIRFTFKFLTGILDTHQVERTVPFDSLNGLDQMILIKLEKTRQVVAQAYGRYEYHKIMAAIMNFINVDLSAGYMEGTKDRLYADATNSRSRMDAQIVLHEIFKALVDMLYPIIPLLVEEVCDYLPDQIKFLPVDLIAGDPKIKVGGVSGVWENERLEKDFDFLLALKAEVQAKLEHARNLKQMGTSLQSFLAIELPDISDGRSNAFTRILERHQDLLEDIFVVSKVNLYNKDKRSSHQNAKWSHSAEFIYPGNKGISLTFHVYEPQADRCNRCWKYNVPRNDHVLEDCICPRCLGVLGGLLEDKPKLKAAAEACCHEQKDKFGRHWEV